MSPKPSLKGGKKVSRKAKDRLNTQQYARFRYLREQNPTKSEFYDSDSKVYRRAFPMFAGNTNYNDDQDMLIALETADLKENVNAHVLPRYHLIFSMHVDSLGLHKFLRNIPDKSWSALRHMTLLYRSQPIWYWGDHGVMFSLIFQGEYPRGQVSFRLHPMTWLRFPQELSEERETSVANLVRHEVRHFLTENMGYNHQTATEKVEFIHLGADRNQRIRGFEFWCKPCTDILTICENLHEIHRRVFLLHYLTEQGGGLLGWRHRVGEENAARVLHENFKVEHARVLDKHGKKTW